MAEAKKKIELEIAHVLFIDIVGYSKLSINDQHAVVEELNQIVRALEKLLSVPYDGALAQNMPLTPALLRLDPMFDPLPHDPRFQKLAESAAPKTPDK